MKAKTLIILGVLAVLALMVVPALALSPLAATSGAPAASTFTWSPPAKPAISQNPIETVQPQDPNGIERLITATGGAVQVSISRATDTVRFISVSPDQPDALSAQLGLAKSKQAQANAFWAQYGSLFGIINPAAQLSYMGSHTDQLGTTRLEYRQVHEGVPVFAGILFLHFNARNQLTAVNGVSVPDITVTSAPRFTAEQADQIAVNAVGPTGIHAAKTTLYVYRTGLAQGIKGINHLAYEVEATNGVNVRDFVIVDALNGKIIDRWSAIESDLHREVYSGTYTLPARIWQEGDHFPYTGVFSVDINSMISTTGETYNLFSSAFGRDSYDAAGAWMRTVNNDPRINCPNANWNGITTNYCTGVSGDDTVAHEWGHAYTEYTHNLIYAWQPGALNESYSDIWGEVVDLLNGRGKDTPGGLRTDGACSIFTSFPPTFTINSPITIAGGYPVAGTSVQVTMPITDNIVIVNDGVGQPGPGVDGTTLTLADGCETPFVNAAEVNGHIALLNRGNCNFTVKLANAQAAGATAIVVANHQAGGDALVNMATPDGLTSPAVFIGYSTGARIFSAITNTVNVTLRPDAGPVSPDNSYRWLSGEDDPAFGEAIRDMWLPSCYNDPNKVLDSNYYCAADDGGGVHTNSGVPNHAFALLVDGGTFNGQTMTGIGLTKAAHLYWRAQDVYQTPTTGFADHADALTASCNDLVAAGTDLPALNTSISTTVLSGQVFTTTDCLQLTKVISATELRTDPTAQCNFQPLFNQSTPSLCAAGTGSPVTVFTDTFEVASGWAVSHTDVYSATNLDWIRRGSLPQGRSGQAFFAIDETAGSQCTSGVGDVSRVMYLNSPAIVAPVSTTLLRLAFDQNIASELNVDGGNLQISVNGSPWRLVAGADYTFNRYNSTLQTAGTGNTNPLAGQPAFTGSDGGLVTTLWGTSLVDLHKYARPGDTIHLRFEFGTDGCGGLEGWYVDNVQLYYCPADPLPTINKTGPAQSTVGAVISYTIVAQAPSGGVARLTDTLPSGITYAGNLMATSGYAVYSTTTNSVYWSNQPLLQRSDEALSQRYEPRKVELRLDAKPMPGVPSREAGAINLPTNPLAVGDPVTLTLDDGTAEDSIGINGGGNAYQFIWLNRFSPAPGSFPFQLQQVRVLFPSTGGVAVGDAIELVVYADPDGNPANGANLLTTFTATVQYADNATWSVYNLPSPVTISGAGDVLIGVIDRFVNSGVTPSNYPAAVDTTASLGRSWAGWWADDPPTPPVLPPNATFDTIDALGLPGNWTVRGYGQTVAPPPPVVTITFNVSVTAAPAGSITNLAQMTWDGLPIQSSTTMTVLQYGVALAPTIDAQVGNPGQIVTYTLRLTNTGNLTDTINLSYAGNAWNVQLPVTQTLLGAGQATNVTVRVTIPTNALSGDSDTVVVTATSQGDVSKTASSNLTTTAGAQYGLVLSPATAAQTQSVGKVVTYTLQLTNTSNTTATFAISSTGNLWTVGLPASPILLAAGVSAPLSVTVSIPVTATNLMTDTVTITVTALADPTKTANVVLTTTAKRYLVYLPLVVK